jgi:hypothetical protein
MISITSRGSSKTDAYLAQLVKKDISASLEKYGQMGVLALSSATPVDSGISSRSWYYKVVRKGSVMSIEWHNTHTVAGVPVVILLQYGHGTGTGGYVQGQDFINPAIKPVMDQIAADVWKVVSSA